MIERMETSRNKAMAAINAANSSAPSLKRDPSLDSQFAGKKYSDSKIKSLSKKSAVDAFKYDAKFTSDSYRTSRKFLGIKNPWFGRKVHETDDSQLLSKSLVKNMEKSYTIKDQAPEGAFYQADRKGEREAREVATRAYLGKGAAQGSLDQISEKANKEMTINDVREILNKN